MEQSSVTIGLPVRSMIEAKAWYGVLLGKEKKTLQPTPEILEFELSKGLWLQLIEDPSLKAGDACLRFGVTDIHVERSRLVAAGIELGEIQEIPGVICLCQFMDPWGNKLSFYQEI